MTNARLINDLFQGRKQVLNLGVVSHNKPPCKRFLFDDDLGLALPANNLCSTRNYMLMLDENIRVNWMSIEQST
jgi:hypothetical protein